jgi:hypothetical protein
MAEDERRPLAEGEYKSPAEDEHRSPAEDECRLEDEQESPVVSKSSARWEGVRLERYRLRRGHFPEHAHEEHAAIVSLVGGGRGEVRTRVGRGLAATGGQRHPDAREHREQR